MKRMQAMVCVSDSVEQALRAIGNRNIPLPVIGNSIDLQVVDQKPVADWPTVAPGIMHAGEQVLLFVGRLHLRKVWRRCSKLFRRCLKSILKCEWFLSAMVRCGSG